MNYFSEASKKELDTCHDDIKKVLNTVLPIFDFKVVCGYRDKAFQNELFRGGYSKLEYPKSKHNRTPSLAVDIAPYPVDYYNSNRFYYLAGLVLTTAKQLGINMRWGGDWNMDGSFKDQIFDDLSHFELIGDKYD